MTVLQPTNHYTGLPIVPSTLPEVYCSLPVPEVLMSGHHARIERWHREQALPPGRGDLIFAGSTRARPALDADERYLSSIGTITGD
jgi:tRNA (guanine37-N1)-methyltransferase